MGAAPILQESRISCGPIFLGAGPTRMQVTRYALFCARCIIFMVLEEDSENLKWWK